MAASKLLLINEFFPSEGNTEAVAKKLVLQQVPAPIAASRIYVANDGSSVLEISAVSDLKGFDTLTTSWQSTLDDIRSHLHGDVQRQVLTYIEAPKPIEALLPQTKYVQMRHVEVRPPVYQDYLVWRENTIFNVVRESADVECFLAYHSVLSSEPGVMFISGFSCDPDQYVVPFTSERSREIVRQAGDKYITGGERGLYTKIYHHFSG